MAAGWLKERWQILREVTEDWIGGKGSFKWAAVAFGAYLLLVFILGIYWSREPQEIAVQQPGSQTVIQPGSQTVRQSNSQPVRQSNRHTVR